MPEVGNRPVHLLILDVLKDLRRKGGLVETAPAFLANLGRVDVLCDLLEKMFIPKEDRVVVVRQLKALLRYKAPIANPIAAFINTTHRKIETTLNE